jgi:hypothetical protein
MGGWMLILNLYSAPHRGESALLSAKSHEADQYSAPIVQHLKTPSKTATMKKTRAKLELEKQRTDKIKNINAKLALSPSRSQNGSPVSRLLTVMNPTHHHRLDYCSNPQTRPFSRDQ